jgi:TPP-dependent pyruvate/acetoin dehydrogenase alpha subunit
LGNNFPVAVGVAMAEKITGQRGVTFVLGGDSSIEEGSFYENLVMAKTFGVEIIFLIENNEWSLGTHISERRCPIDLQKMADSVGISFLKLEGNHVHEYTNELNSIRENVLRESSPACIEVMVKTLGDRIADDGHYINYHAGPALTVDTTKFMLKESEEDPVFVLKQEIGQEKLNEFAEKIMEELKNEIR